jgi:TDG/mug DNA glycosylase family protein
MNTKQGLDPVIGDSARVLILGTMPGDESLRQQRYYSHGRNQLWDVLARVYGEQVSADYKDKLDFLHTHQLALWDVLREAVRPGSLDSDIKEPVPNDFVTLFAEYPQIDRVALNGTKAQALWRRFVAKKEGVPPSLRVAALPSTSPTPGSSVCSFAEKVAQWKAFLTA